MSTTKCNLCKTLSREEALQCCVHEGCPHKQHEVTEEDLAINPELVDAGIKAGDTIELGPVAPDLTPEAQS